jgi:nicotinate-nucleotide pyrophosphorylase (carboxylating)
MMRPLPPDQYRDIVRRALAEDIGPGDVTTNATVRPEQRARGVFLAKSGCVLAGIDVAVEAFRQLEPDVQAAFRKTDGDRLTPGESFGEVTGSARTLLIGERTALNFLQRLSGIATAARRFVDAAAGRIIILDTRKTTPTLRALEKYAVAAGGATNHRIGLFDAVLIKDNHISLAGGVSRAVALVRDSCPDLRIEVEAQTLGEVDAAVKAKADVILVDNMSIDEIRQAVSRVHGQAKIEISGGVSLDRIPQLATTGADFVSVGALTHSAAAADISFEIEPV